MPFEGFSTRLSGEGFTAIPNAFFSSLLPQITDIIELRATLYIFWALYRKKGYPRYITLEQMLGDQSLMQVSSADDLKNGLALAASRGTLLHLQMEDEAGVQDLYFINDEQGRKALSEIENGQIDLGDVVRVEPASTEELPDIFTLYEQHVGMLTPLVADELKEAEETYPVAWIEEAFKEAAALNKRSWRYISRILERWHDEGKDDGRTGKSSQKDLSPEEYIRKYSRFTRK